MAKRAELAAKAPRQRVSFREYLATGNPKSQISNHKQSPITKIPNSKPVDHAGERAFEFTEAVSLVAQARLWRPRADDGQLAARSSGLVATDCGMGNEPLNKKKLSSKEQKESFGI